MKIIYILNQLQLYYNYRQYVCIRVKAKGSRKKVLFLLAQPLRPYPLKGVRAQWQKELFLDLKQLKQIFKKSYFFLVARPLPSPLLEAMNFQAIDQTENIQKSDFFLFKNTLHTCATCSVLPYNLETMFLGVFLQPVLWNEESQQPNVPRNWLRLLLLDHSLQKQAGFGSR